MLLVRIALCSAVFFLMLEVVLIALCSAVFFLPFILL